VIDLTASCTGQRQIKDFKRELQRARQKTLAITKQNTDWWKSLLGGRGEGGKNSTASLALLKSRPCQARMKSF